MLAQGFQLELYLPDPLEAELWQWVLSKLIEVRRLWKELFKENRLYLFTFVFSTF